MADRRVSAVVIALVACAVCLVGSVSAASAEDTVWLCKPGQDPDPCRESLETTIQKRDGSSRVEDPGIAQHPKTDCFYVYPTVSQDPGTNSDRNPGPEEMAIARYQGSRFSQICRVFSPMYRQRSLLAISGPPEVNAEALRTAYSDIRAAWHDYLHKYNHGRGVVLIGHSQGTTMLRQLIRDRIDERPSVRRRIISAIMLGGNVTVKEGKLVDGDFDHFPGCTSRRQTACAIAWSTFDEPPPNDTRFGRPTAPAGNPFDFPTGAGYDVLCTNPSKLLGENDALTSLSRTEPFPGIIGALIVAMYGGVPPSASTPWVRPAERYTAKCRVANHADVLMLRPIDGARNLNEEPDKTWGLHLLDMNIAMGELVRIVQSETRAYLSHAG